MSAERPNYIHMHLGERNFSDSFGQLSGVTPVHFAGNGHLPHVEARFCGGLRLDFTPQTLVQFLRAGQEALAKLPLTPNCSGALADLGGDDA